MASRAYGLYASLALVVAVVGCSPSTGDGGRPATGDAGTPTTPSARIRVTAGITGVPPAMVTWLASTGLRGIDAVQDLLSPGLTEVDNHGLLQPKLAERVPTVENGLWVLQPDGRMETTWKIRPGALWHDGTPLTADDVVFTSRVQRDPDLPLFANTNYAQVEDVTAPDASTIVVSWKRPYIDADGLFSDPIIPRHLLESALADDKPGFIELPYWRDGFIGTGPFRLREFVQGSHLVLDANDQYVLGRPKIDTLEIRFIPEPSMVAANLMAGAIELTLGKTLSVEQAIEVENNWTGGRADYFPSSALRIYVQHIDANPRVITNADFRRAALFAIDRQQLADTLLGSKGEVANSFMYPGQEAYREIEARLPRYDYDPRRAAELIGGLGYTKGTDGMYRDAAGQTISMELRSEVTDINMKSNLAIVEGWQRLGIAATSATIPPQAAASSEYLATYPGMWLRRNRSDRDGLKNLYSSVIPKPENNFRAGNMSRFGSAELDGLLDSYFTTIPEQERTQALGRALYFLADQLPEIELFFDVEPTIISNRLQNITGRWPGSTQAWNAQDWVVQGPAGG